MAGQQADLAAPLTVLAGIGPALAIELSQSYPNPFAGSTTIGYRIANSGFVELAVFDVMGRRVETLASGYEAPGQRSIKWHANSAAPGMYLVRLRVGDQVVTDTVVIRP